MIHTSTVLYTQGSNKRGTEVRHGILGKILHFFALLVTGGTKQWFWPDKG